MFRLFTYLTFIFSTQTLYSQQGFKKLYSGEITGAAFSNIILNNDTLVTTGILTTDTSANYTALMITLLDTNGTIIHTNLLFDPDIILTEPGYALIKTSNGQFATVGRYVGAHSSFLAIYNSDGTLDKYVKYPDSIAFLYWLNSLVELPDGFLLGGNRIGPDYTGFQLIRTDQNGNIKWQKNYYHSNIVEGLSNLSYIDNNTFLIGGGRCNCEIDPLSETWFHSFILAVDSLGNKKWEWENNSGTETTVDNLQFISGHGWIYTTGRFEYFSQPEKWGYQSKIVCRDYDFNLLWERNISQTVSQENILHGLASDDKGDWIAIGEWVTPILQNGPANYKGASISKTSVNGDSLWNRLDTVLYNPQAAVSTYLGGLVIFPSGSIIAAGYVEEPLTLRPYGLLIKVNKDGCIDTTFCQTNSALDMENITKTKVFPTLTNGLVHIENPIGSSIKVHTLMGSLVMEKTVTDIDETIDFTNLPAGQYIIFMGDKRITITYKVIKI
jgi:hypothetical protein